MKKTLLLLLSLVSALNMSAKVIELDFTKAGEAWGIPTEKTKDAGTFTDAASGVSVTLTAPDAYYFSAGNSVVIIGKQGATLTFSAFDFAVGAIEIVGGASASTAVKQNIFVGDDAVSSMTTGAKVTEETPSNIYLIDAAHQAAGTIYTLKVLSTHNTQISTIKIYDVESAPQVEVPTYTPVGAGTLEKPYTLADVKGFQNMSNCPTTPVWVKGVIGGHIADTMTGEFGVPASAEESSASNMALGTAEDYISVQLPSGGVRAALNLADNFENLGKEVYILGLIDKYCGVAGVKSVSDYSWDGQTTGIRTAITVPAAKAHTFDLQGRKTRATRGLFIQGGAVIMK